MGGSRGLRIVARLTADEAASMTMGFRLTEAMGGGQGAA